MEDCVPSNFETLIRQAEEAHFQGWDFSWLKDRKTSLQIPWDYETRVRQRMQGINAMLDLGTGGGEFLSQLATFPQHTCATEGYGPNVVVAKERLQPLGIHVVNTSTDPENCSLPFADGEFELIISRHDEYVAAELYRVLQTGGYFVTQQCGGYGLNDLIEWFKGPGSVEPMDWTLDVAVAELEQLGFGICDAQEACPRVTFSDVGAIVYYLRGIPWLVSDFTVDGYRKRLLDVHERIQEYGGFTVTDQRFFVEAMKLG